VKYTNKGTGAANNVILYDRISASYILYKAGSLQAPAGWTKEYSTNTNPDQSYTSTHYTTTEPAASNVKWVRWKKASVSAGESGVMTFSVIIK
jgi:hypothetical protein